jgi:thiamine-phosphate pyrophosphorylase
LRHNLCNRMKLILITTPTYFVEEDKIITTLFDEGLDILHLRKPDTAPVYAERLLTLIPEKYHKRIVVHDHFYLKEEYKLKGIHLSHRNPLIPDNYTGHVSASCHTFDEVMADKKMCDYVFLSPIFDSISKEGYASAFTSESIREAAEKGIIDKRVIALGGVDENNLLQVKDFGFGGAAILGGLWNKFDPASDYNYQELIAHFRKLKRLAD